MPSISNTRSIEPQPTPSKKRGTEEKKTHGAGAAPLAQETRSAINKIESKIPKEDEKRIEDQTEEDDMKITPEDIIEAEERGLEPRQWKNTKIMAKVISPENPMGWIKGQLKFENGVIHAIHGLKIIHWPGTKRIPKNLKCHGTFYLTNCPGLKQLPAGLEITEDLWASGSGIVDIPDDMKLGRALIADFCPNLKTVSKKQFNSNVTLMDCKSLVSLADGFQAQGAVRLDRSAIKALPHGMKAEMLSVLDCDALEGFPDDLQIRKSGDSSKDISPNLVLSPDANPKLKKEAETLKGKDQIDGIVVYWEKIPGL